MALKGIHTVGEDYAAGDVVYDDAGNIYFTSVAHTATAENVPVAGSYTPVPPTLFSVLQRSVDVNELTPPAQGQREYLYWEDV